MTYKFIKLPHNPDYGSHDPTTIEFTIDSEVTLTTLIEEFQSFLKASGYSFDGTLELVEEESVDNDSLKELE